MFEGQERGCTFFIAHTYNGVRKKCSKNNGFVDKKRHFTKFNTFFFGIIVLFYYFCLAFYNNKNKMYA